MPHRTWLASNQGTCRAGPRMAVETWGRTMVRGSGAGPDHRRATNAPSQQPSCVLSTSGCGPAWCGADGGPTGPSAVTPLGAYARCDAERTMRTCTSTPRPIRAGAAATPSMGGTLVGTLLVIGGLWLAYVAWNTPILAAISARDPARRDAAAARHADARPGPRRAGLVRGRRHEPAGPHRRRDAGHLGPSPAIDCSRILPDGVVLRPRPDARRRPAGAGCWSGRSVSSR